MVAQDPLVRPVADTLGLVLCRVAGARPGRVQGLWLAEAEVVHGRLGKGHAEEVILVVRGQVDAIVGSVFESDGRRIRGGILEENGGGGGGGEGAEKHAAHDK